MTHQTKTSYDAISLFHVPMRQELDPETGLDVTLHKYGRQELIQAVRDEGVDMHITRGKHAYADRTSVSEVLIPHFDGQNMPTVTKLGEKLLSDYGVTRTIAGKVEGDGIPTLNHSGVKELANDKLAAAAMLKVMGMHEGSMLVRSTDDLNSLIDAMPGENFVLKPRSGRMSVGTLVGSKGDIIKGFDERDDKIADYVLEEKLNFSTPFPSSIRGYDDVNQARLELANDDGANKELRTIYFGDNKYCYIARAAHKGDKDFKSDDWVYIDPATIPDDIVAIDRQVVQAIEKKTGIREFHIAIDKTFATTDTAMSPKWRVMEINAGEPQLVRTRQHQVIAREQTKLLAEQIARIARKRSLQ